MAVSAFLAAGINPNVKDPERGETALIAAAARGDLSIVKALLQGGADVNTKSEVGATALLRTLENTHYAVADTLLAQPTLDVNAQGGNGWTALIYSVTSDREEIVPKLLERGANVNLQDGEGDTALHRAAQNGNVKILPMLLAQNANPNLKNKLGGTALLWAAAFGHD
ncbi:MAG: ankyrin repeat domain-containing protein, partial [Pyrinomonadaceae bacterium]